MEQAVKEIYILLLIVAAVFIVSILVGYQMGSEPQHCRNVVLEDIQEHQVYESKLAQLVNPDFLTTLTKGSK